MMSDRAVEVMEKAGIDRLQITLDGLREIHDQRRPSKVRVISSFEQTILGLEKVIEKFVIRLRISEERELRVLPAARKPHPRHAPRTRRGVTFGL